uniref:Tektin bundle interacting protein 1 n=1 Tax=Sphenodon punctatus TaxID=8508 RepID=A0A8D0HEJ1_SPHPU
MDSVELARDRPYVPQGTLETDFPSPLYSDEYRTLRGPRNAPILKQAVRWKCTPMGWDTIPQSWYTGLTNSNNHEAWYALTNATSREAYRRWGQSHARRERKTLPPAYAQHLREACWYDPIVPAQYLEPSTRWGAFRWQDKLIPGKEYVVNRNRCAQELRGRADYVPFLSFHTPVFTAKDYSTWRILLPPAVCVALHGGGGGEAREPAVPGGCSDIWGKLSRAPGPCQGTCNRG